MIMKSKFQIIYENIMRSVIVEDWDRWHLYQIALATKAITNDFADEWDDESTSKKISEELKSIDHLKGSKHVINGNAQVIGDYSDENRESEKILNSCLNYWKFRSENLTDEKYRGYVDKCYKIFYLWNSAGYDMKNGKTTYTIVEVGFVAKAIWKAMHNIMKNKEMRTAKADEMNLDEDFKVGSSVKINFKFKDLTSFDGRYGSSPHLIGTDERWPDVKFDIPITAALKRVHLDDFKNCPENRKNNSLFDLILDDEMTVNATIKEVKKQYLTVVLTKVQIEDFIHYEKTTYELMKEKRNSLVSRLVELGVKDAYIKILIPEDKLMQDYDLVVSALKGAPDCSAITPELWEEIKEYANGLKED